MAVHSLEILLYVAAGIQISVAILNLCLSRLLGWRQELDRLPRLLREVGVVHSIFISLTLAIFATLTWRFAAVMAVRTDPVATWLAGSIAVFWAIRTIIQWAYYSPRHWLGKPPQTLAHLVLTLLYGGMTFVYTAAACT